MVGHNDLLRGAMVESQLRTDGIDDSRLIEVYREVERERFLPKGLRHLAYRDEDIVLECGGGVGQGGGSRVMLEPVVEATMIKHAAIGLHSMVVVVGAYPGCLAYVASRLGSVVFAYEANTERALELRREYEDLEAGNIVVEEKEVKESADAIIFSAAVARVPEEYFKGLALGGRLIAIVRESQEVPGRLMVFSKSRRGLVDGINVREVYTPWLAGFGPVPRFVF